MRALVVLAALVFAGCGGAAGTDPTPGPPLAAAELKYRVMDAAGRISFCDPDFYPVARTDEQELARQKISDIRADASTYAAIAARVGTDELAVYREWKALGALALQPVNDVFGFSYIALRPDKSSERVEGRVTASGRVTVLSRSASGPPNCPICLARGTRIATPSGEIAVELLRVGDLVWTADAEGRRVAAPLAAVGSTPVPATHQVVALRLEDGRVLELSPGHPLADGRIAGMLVVYDTVDGARVMSAAREPYLGGATFDVLPAGATGQYWANGVALRSTLRCAESSFVRNSTMRP